MPHTFWLIASLFSCGLFAIVWGILTITNSSKPFLCPICGLVTGQNPQAFFNTTANQISSGKSAFVPSKQLSTGAKVAIGIFALFFGIPLLITFISAFVNPNAQQNPSLLTAPSQLQQTSSVDNNWTNKPKEISKYKTKEARIKAGVIEMNDAQGNARPYSLGCWKQMNEMDIFAEKRLTMGIKTAIFERCIELNGNAKQAVSEMAQLFKSR